jgi:hypothetical protein
MVMVTDGVTVTKTVTLIKTKGSHFRLPHAESRVIVDGAEGGT